MLLVDEWAGLDILNRARLIASRARLTASSCFQHEKRGEAQLRPASRANTLKMESRIVVMFVLYTFASTKVVTGDDATFGACLPGKESCSECYLTLKQSLLGRDDNIQRLSNAFFPPRSNIPEFVTVTYVFENSNESQIWYWTHDSSYLFFQFTTFQYLSLFFSKPAERFSQQVILTLNESCINAPNTTFRLLTQRVSVLKIPHPSVREKGLATIVQFLVITR